MEMYGSISSVSLRWRLEIIYFTCSTHVPRGTKIGNVFVGCPKREGRKYRTLRNGSVQKKTLKRRTPSKTLGVQRMAEPTCIMDIK